MSDFIKHECGIALIRLRKPLAHYAEHYGTGLYGLQKLDLLLQKIRNRGQDGAGLATIKLHPEPGTRYISRHRSNDPNALKALFKHVYKSFKKVKPEQLRDADYLKANFPYTGELLMGHLRYGTHGRNNVEMVHPFFRSNNWISRNLVLAGNFNLTNVDEQFQTLVNLGQYPKEQSDTVTVLEKIGHFLDNEVERLHAYHKAEVSGHRELNEVIFRELNVQRVLERATKRFDGGYVMGGLIGHGDAFFLRDRAGIRPAYYYIDDEIVVCCSERPAIQTAFDVHISEVHELPPSHALIIKRDGPVTIEEVRPPLPRASCSFERIYFSRGTDRDIYLERKRLGEQLARPVMEMVNYDFANTVFSFIPNTAEASYYGLVKAAEQLLSEHKQEQIEALYAQHNGQPDPAAVRRILQQTVRSEVIVKKDEKLRTFIADDKSRGNMVAYGYDVTYGIVQNEVDTLVVIDDSIVRGTTLRDSIIQILSRLRPKRIIVVSSAPQIRYPDCYGIDMSKMKDFVAFRALVALLEESDQAHLLDEAYKRARKNRKKPAEKQVNELAALYDRFDYETVSRKIAELITPPHIAPQIDVLYQTVEGVQRAIPVHNGDWYFSGNYPTPGGARVVNRAFMNYMEGLNVRAY